MLAQEPRYVAVVQAVAARHARLSDDDAAYLLWNETAYPFCNMGKVVRQVRDFFGEFDPRRGGA